MLACESTSVLSLVHMSRLALDCLPCRHAYSASAAVAILFLCVCHRTVNDRQAGTLPARPGEPEYLAMSTNWLLEATYSAALYRSMFLEQMANAQRGTEVRGLELADRFIKPYDTVRPVVAVAVGSIKMNGKTNQVTTPPQMLASVKLTSKSCCAASTAYLAGTQQWS